MSSPWTFVYPHRDPARLAGQGYAPNEAEARRYRGLVLTPIYNPIDGIVLWDWWELRHEISTEALFFIRAAGDEMAEAYATRVAEMANWPFMRTVPEWTAPPHSHDLIAYLGSTKNVFFEPDMLMLFPDLAAKLDEDFDEHVPYA